MNVYDFDRTVYTGDSTLDFYGFCLRQHPTLARFWPRQALGAARYLLGAADKTALKESFFSFLQGLGDVHALVERFWQGHHGRIAEWYLRQQCAEDVIITASPAFLVAPLCARLGLQPPIASLVNPADGRFQGLNCHGEEKVQRFTQCWPQAQVQAFYSDSLSDAPMAALADRAWLVTRGVVKPWPTR